MNRKPYSLHTFNLKLATFSLVVCLLGADVLSSCRSNKPRKKLNRTQRGAFVGAGGGALVGGVIGSKIGKGNTAIGAIMGAAVGGTAGALIGRRMDKQAAELRRDLQNAQVERVGEGIRITFDSDLLFDVDKYNLKSNNRQNLAKLAETLKKYEDTEVLIEGHADITGSDAHNQKLSEQRARTVAQSLQSLGIANSRIDEKGYGSSQPIADNSTAAGRQQNRRVEVAIYANKKLKKAAERGDLNVNS